MLRLNSEPKYAQMELLAIFQYNHHVLVDDGIAPYYCSDGFCDPMKKVAWEEQENKYNVAKQWPNCFYHDACNDCPIDDARRKSVMKYLRDITIPDLFSVILLNGWVVKIFLLC
jgi:hypothetical protein